MRAVFGPTLNLLNGKIICYLKVYILRNASLFGQCRSRFECFIGLNLCLRADFGKQCEFYGIAVECPKIG